jgi:diguanylate cyclase (GGDEF)-like protein
MPHDIQARLRRRLQGLLSPGILPALVLTACLAVTAVLWHGATLDAEQEAQTDFEFRVRELVNNLDQRMQTYVQVLYGAQGLFASSEQVSREEFATYLAGQELHQHFPGVHAVGFIKWIGPQQLAAHEAAMRQQGFAGFHIFPPGARDWHAAVTYVEPFNANNRLAFGFDVASEARRRAALEQARDSGLPAMSGSIRLLQETGAAPQAGFLVLLPVYDRNQSARTLGERRAAIRGWVYAPFRTGDLMAGLGSTRGPALGVAIYDGDSIAPDALMYRSGPDGAAQRVTRQQISIANHRWTLRIWTPPGTGGARTDKAQQMALFGAALSALLAGFTWLLSRSRMRARAALERSRALAEELKEGQSTLMVLADSAQRSQAMLRSILDSTVDGILVDNLQGTVLNSNRRFRELWNVPEYLDWQSDGAVLITHMCAQLLEPECGLRLDEPAQLLLPGVQRGAALEEEHEVLRLKDGRVIEKHTRGLQLGSEPARIWSFRDVTERTQIEQREQTRRHVLELLATGAPLQTILEAVVLAVEEANKEMLCSILLVDERGEHLLVGAAPSLPSFYNAAIHGKPIACGQAGCGLAVQTRSRVITEDIRSDPAWAGYHDLVRQAQLGSCWSDPIISTSGAVLGTFAIYHRDARLPSMANIALIEQAARLAGIAIEQAQAAIALRAGEARFRSLYDHAPVALWEQDWSAVRAALAEMELSGIDDLAAYLQANPSQLRRLATLVRIIDCNAAALDQVAAPAGRKDMAALTLAQNFDTTTMANFAQAVTALAQGRHFFACEGSFQRLDGVARLNELTLLVMPGHTLSLDFVIVSTLDITERRRMDDELRVLATTDFLTGLPNRREFMGRLAEEQGRLQRDIGACAAVLLLDIDHFKRINDEYGHAAGDAVLRQLAEVMRECQRKIDMLGRIGGEEFAVLLPGTELDAAAVFAERLRQRVAETPMRIDDGRSLHITVSIGIAAMGGRHPAGDTALIRADQALYRAKDGGRNRVERMEADRPGQSVPAASD